MPQDKKAGQVRVMIVDDHVVVRDSIRLSLNAFENIRIVAEAANGEQAMQLCREMQPDVILLSLPIPNMDGAAAVRQIQKSHPPGKVIVLSGSDNQRIVEQALQAGAYLCVSKNVAVNKLASAIQSYSTNLSQQQRSYKTPSDK